MKNKKQDNFNSVAIKSGSGYMIANILIRASALLTAPIFTRILSTSDYGIAANFIAWMNIFLIFTGLGLPYSIGVAKMDFPKQLNKYIASIQTLGNISALIFLIIAVLFKQKLAEWMILDGDLVLVMFIYLLVLPSVVFSQEKYKFQLKYKENIYIAFVNSFGAIFSCLILIFFVFNVDRYYGRIIGLILPMFLMGIFFFIKIIREGWFANVKKYWKYALKISLPMIPHALAMVVLNQIDRIMIIDSSGSSDAGLYSFGFAYAILLMIFSNAILQAYKPWLYTKYKTNELLQIKDSHRIITFIVCLLTIVIIAVGPEVLKVLGAKEFWEAKWVIVPIALSALFQYIYNSYSSLELYHKKTKIIAIGSVITALINYMLNSSFIPIYGYTAAAYTTFISYLILSIFHYFGYKNICKKVVFDDNFIWVSALLTIGVSFIMLFFYNSILLRYTLLILLLGLVFILKKNKIKEVSKTLFITYKK
ncbi:oligosaccharide flippase family protein [Polaribacter dokdonensis]|uniref:Membrane protein involved in the export of O-antigen and teichoic acid n=1 Tax=Polaribacter dokdonensis DSW-5 TaxID=1300348 RepID=A0A0M9CDW0_9FLAO|nr:oligosaccharide flippase family protein [Polaribacter dokdonensis]KOY50661.1 hypothetical protein I602_221 [Polaribacter dokdonensis DSW-5]SEE62387.1 Membrane protein involved in the export of O-antigen and teichoic acid [Polaribacter dokdonensis DSW-5]